MANNYVPRLSWEPAFLEQLAKLRIIKRSAIAAGVTTGAVYSRRNKCPEFAAECDRILAEPLPEEQAQPSRNGEGAPAPGQWKRVFLAALAEISNVTASADLANVSTREVYQTRRADREFADAWQEALYEGYVNLEMEVLGYLREPRPERKMDVANALRLLAAHKDTFAKQQAVRANVSAAEVRASIEKRVEALRQQVLARRKREAECRN